MAYVKQNFVKGQILTAEHMNHIEDGIVAAADAQSLGGKAPEYYIQPRNLLDNSDFRNPVNQRGASSYSGAVYSIDRWRSWREGSAIAIGNGYITLSGDVHHVQYIDSGIFEDGKSYTYAIMQRDGTMYLASVTFPMAAEYSESGRFTLLLRDSDMSYVTINGAGEYVWAALYEGTYSADTLPPYVPKGYATELAECMRYYQTIPYYIAQNGINENTSYPSCFPMNFFPMRIAPTATLKESWNSNVTSKTIDNVTTQSLSVGFALDSSSNGFLQWKGTIILSADL